MMNVAATRRACVAPVYSDNSPAINRRVIRYHVISSPVLLAWRGVAAFVLSLVPFHDCSGIFHITGVFRSVWRRRRRFKALLL